MARRESTNPALTRIPAFQQGGYAGFRDRPGPAPEPSPAPTGGIDYRKPTPQPYGAPGSGWDAPAPPSAPAGTGRMTVEDVIVKTSLMLGVVAVAGALTWVLDLEALAIPAAIIAFVMVLVISFKQITNPAVMLSFAVVEGVFLGGISKLLAGFAGGDESIVLQAVVGTVGVAAAMLALYKSGRIRVTPQFQKMVILATVGFFILMLANLAFSLISSDDSGGLRSFGPVGILVGLVAIVLASLNLVLDFDLIEKAAANGAPERFAWLAAFGLVVTLVWLYTEILRLLAIFNSD